MTSLLFGGGGAPESRDMGRMRAHGSEALPREALEVSLSIRGRLPHAMGCLEAQGCRSAPPKGSLPSSVWRPSKGPAPFACLNHMHNFQTLPLQ